MSLSFKPRIRFSELSDELGSDLLEENLVVDDLPEHPERRQRCLLRLDEVPSSEDLGEFGEDRLDSIEESSFSVGRLFELDVGDDETTAKTEGREGRGASVKRPRLS